MGYPESDRAAFYALVIRALPPKLEFDHQWRPLLYARHYGISGITIISRGNDSGKSKTKSAQTQALCRFCFTLLDNIGEMRQITTGLFPLNLRKSG